MPDGVKFYNHHDSSEFVILSVEAVVSTLIIAFILVFCVVMLFIQNIKGTIIPVIVNSSCNYWNFCWNVRFGLSINTLTLFGMVLAIGIVVDDAIVVLENVERLMAEEGLNSVQAAIKGMEQVAAPVIAVVCVLNAVFIPVAFLGGFSGILMQQFAVTIAISVLLSGVVALTLTPTLCAIFLRNVKHGEKHESKFKPLQWVYWFFDKFNVGFVKFQELYMTVVVKIIDNAKKAMIAWCFVILAVIVLFIKIPTGLVPLEDMGYYYDTIHVNSGGAIDYNVDEAVSLSKDLMNHIPELDRIAILGGKDIVDNGSTKTNTSTLSVIMSDYSQRPDVDQGVDAVIKKLLSYRVKHLRITGFRIINHLFVG